MYITNYADPLCPVSGEVGKVSFCAVLDGKLSACTNLFSNNTSLPFKNPNGIILNADETIAYVSDLDAHFEETLVCKVIIN